MSKRCSTFEDGVFSLFDGFHKEKGEDELSFDYSHCKALVDTGGWGSETGLQILNWSQDKGAKHIKTELKKFLRWGGTKFKEARYPYIPAIPDFDQFRERKKPVKKKE